MSSALDFMLAARRSELQGLRALELTCELVSGVSRLVHALQRERGFSNICLGSQDPRFRAGLDDLTADSLARQAQVIDCFNRMDLDSSCGADKARLFNRIAYVMHCLQGLPLLRQGIRQQQLSSQDATRHFTRPIGGLLSVVFEAADTAVDPDITRSLVALFNFMQGKELAGQERACGVAGFIGGYFNDELKVRLQYLGEAQQRCFDCFADHADAAMLSQWQSLCDQDVLGEIGRLRQVAVRSLKSSPMPGSLAELWFDLASQRIDSMKLLEDSLTEQLQQLCHSKIAQAQSDLENHRALLQRLSSLDRDAEQPATMLFNVQVTELDSVPADNMGSQLNRSVFDVLHAQTLRLQELGQQLDEARRSLSERKLVDRAKGLLMAQHGLKEDEAYRMLQNAAMERSQRLADVAQTLLDYADLLQGKARAKR
ncbi:MAG: transcription antitermination regulator [Gammaproteobacteria bacterium HGW-Gammaproteobacteria-6]|nr:MAG: transcription antitermination regulator [Gammaproteobacteria bacterium HGW-Gammaproteobacteria-6]